MASKKKVQSASPLPQSPTPKLHTFPEAIPLIVAGSRMTKLEWNNPEIYILLRDRQLQLHKDDGKFYTLTVTDGDMVGNDWVVI